jgi:hypothetical protein
MRRRAAESSSRKSFSGDSGASWAAANTSGLRQRINGSRGIVWRAAGVKMVDVMRVYRDEFAGAAARDCLISSVETVRRCDS